MKDAASEIPWLEDYDQLLHHAGLVDLQQRTQIELTGADRATFLHNLCTNDVRQLAPGAGREAFMTTVQGKTLGHVLVYAGPEAIVIDTVPGESEKLLKHLNRYLVCEQVTITDRSHQGHAFLLSGAFVPSVLQSLPGITLGGERFAHQETRIAGKPVWLRRADMVGAKEVIISTLAADASAVRDALLQSGARLCRKEAFEAARIEHGFPWYGRDVTDTNLPQEIARDASAISFVKGCYLGQETVARIDALGHVNQMLVGIQLLGGAPPEHGSQLSAGNQVVGIVTSAAYSPQLGTALALGFVKRGHHSPGSPLQSSAGPGQVVALPVR